MRYKVEKFASIFLMSIWTLALIPGCDYIDDPIQTGGGTDTTGTVIHRVLVEDYTGHKCPNCPAAAAEAEALMDVYGDQVVVIGVHAGFFASPSPGYEYDFRTEAGDELNGFFGFTAYPAGMINRLGYLDGNHILNFQAWPPEVSEALQTPPSVALDLTASISGGQLSATASLTALSELSGAYSVVLAVTEDSIVQPQVSQLPQGGTETIEDYVHNHVLRGHMNGTWGSEVWNGNILAGESVDYSESISVGGDWRPEHLHVVAYLYNNDSFEVVEVNEVKL